MDLDTADGIAARFLFDYVAQNKHFTPDADLQNPDAEDFELHVLIFAWSVVKDGKVVTDFRYGRSVDLDQHDVQAHAEACIAAMKQAHPEVHNIPFEIQISKDEP
jgi:hypothetical protein